MNGSEEFARVSSGRFFARGHFIKRLILLEKHHFGAGGGNRTHPGLPASFRRNWRNFACINN
jgi:hypothetical protein